VTGGLGVVLLGGDLSTVREVSEQVQSAGLDSVWTTEFYERSAPVSLAVMAQCTSTVTVGSAIAYAVGRSPLVLAAEARDIDELSEGRLVLGLGTGTRTMQRDWHGSDPSSPAARVEELVPLLRRFWTMDDSGVDHDGRFYSVHLRPTVDVRPPRRGDIPVYLAGVNPRMVRSAGRVADGLIGHPLFTRRYVDEVVRPALDLGAAEAHRARSEVALTGYLLCSVHDRSAVARQEAKAQIAFYAVVRSYAGIFDLHGYADQAGLVREAWQRRDREAMVAAVPDALVDLIAISGTPDEVRQRFEAERADVYDHTMLYSPSFGLPPGRLSDNVTAIVETFGHRAGGRAAP
jgi:probable F420-dependent oxidoreductase